MLKGPPRSVYRPERNRLAGENARFEAEVAQLTSLKDSDELIIRKSW